MVLISKSKPDLSYVDLLYNRAFKKFPIEVQTLIIKFIGFETVDFEKSVPLYRDLNSHPLFKKLISRTLSIWVNIPHNIKFDLLKSKQLRHFSQCTDSFFITTTSYDCITNFGSLNGLIFDVNGFLQTADKRKALTSEEFLSSLLQNSWTKPDTIVYYKVPSLTDDARSRTNSRRFEPDDLNIDGLKNIEVTLYNVNNLRPNIPHKGLQLLKMSMKRYYYLKIIGKYFVDIEERATPQINQELSNKLTKKKELLRRKIIESEFRNHCNLKRKLIKGTGL